MKTRLQEYYEKEVVTHLIEKIGYRNPMQVPRLVKIVLNIGVGEATQNIKVLDAAVGELALIAGQHPIIKRAKKSIAAFKLKAGMPIGCKASLRGQRMYDFLDKLIHFALPRIRDFKGLSDRSFDGRGNYTIGIHEHIIFPEINYDKIDKIKGMNITFVTTAKTDNEGKALLEKLGLPFRS
jgi:large subunit ribosomal protein L5